MDGIPEPGDLIEVYRTGYQHWALYVGDGYVIHLAPPCEDGVDGAHSIMSVASRKAHVRLQLLKEVVGTSHFRVNNKTGSPLPVDAILRRARSLVGETQDYDLIGSNCEHFVTELRYGEARSDQVRRGLWAAGLSVAAVVGVLAAATWGGSKTEEEQQRGKRQPQ